MLPASAPILYGAGMPRLILCSLFLLSMLAPAQNPAPPAAPSPAIGATALPLFRATLPGGTYEVAVKNIVSVSTHEYLVDAAARVTEVNIDTLGSLLVRFYYLEPNTPAPPAGIGATVVDKAQQLLTQGAEKSGIDAWKKVTKSYPATTHARTVEYRLTTKEDVAKVFDAAEEAFRLQKNKQVKIE